ncbi:MAG: aminoglycoside phosphotransferase family protein [candidate division KSB1 bacterium]|nr:aminoglycoside phosphotransferase family protein [candidate division KSB1 bacterium]MDZ7365085.1 aminoglycoside phosphotransferase family protein [candidate division KSB1 bacterium]MDZ7407247.1 aminoglycoside phosphotransferase family protein [candidate division KSB1 bacterium]
MAEIFSKNLRPALAEQSLQIERCAVEWLQHRRGRRCRLLYRLNMRDAGGQTIDQWFFGKLLRPGQARREYEEAMIAASSPNGLWQPLYLWPDLEMVIWSFPHDPAMPGLRQAADPIWVQARLNSQIAALGLPAAWRCEEVVVERVKYMPGKRCVLRCHARLADCHKNAVAQASSLQADMIFALHCDARVKVNADSSGASRCLSFYSKTYADGKSVLHFANLQKLYANALRNGQSFKVPRPLAHWDEANTLWQESWEGRPLIDRLGELDWEKLFPRIAAALAAFHQSPCDHLPEVEALERGFEAVQEDAPMLGWLLPQQQARFDEAQAAIAAAKEILSRQPAPHAPTHGTMRLEQILFKDGDMALVDFDAAALSDPHLDVAEFLISLQFLEFSHGLPRQRLAAAAQSFQAAYARQVPWRLDPQRVAWHAAVSLLDKLHEALRNLDANTLQKLEAILEVMEDWLKIISK